MEPKQLAHQWMKRIIKKEWARMPSLCQKTWLSDMDKSQTKIFIQNVYGKLEITKYKILEIKEVTEVRHTAEIEVDCILGSRKILMNIICETGPYKPSVDGEWGINPLSAMIKPNKTPE